MALFGTCFNHVNFEIEWSQTTTIITTERKKSTHIKRVFRPFSKCSQSNRNSLPAASDLYMFQRYFIVAIIVVGCRFEIRILCLVSCLDFKTISRMFVHKMELIAVTIIIGQSEYRVKLFKYMFKFTWSALRSFPLLTGRVNASRAMNGRHKKICCQLNVIALSKFKWIFMNVRTFLAITFPLPILLSFYCIIHSFHFITYSNTLVYGWKIILFEIKLVNFSKIAWKNDVKETHF